MKKKVLVYERKGYRNNLYYPEKCEILKYFGNGCYLVKGLKSNVIERIYKDEMREL